MINFIKTIFIPSVILLMLGYSAVVYSGYGKIINKKPKPETVFIFGYVNLDDAPFSLNEAGLRQVLPKTKKSYKKMRLDKNNGIFYMENLPVGSYTFHGFSGYGKKYYGKYYFPVDSDDRNHRVKKSGFYYLGSFDIKPIDQATASIPGRYTINKVNTPSETHVLKMILKNVSGTKWEQLIKNRIEELQVQEDQKI